MFVISLVVFSLGQSSVMFGQFCHHCSCTAVFSGEQLLTVGRSVVTILSWMWLRSSCMDSWLAGWTVWLSYVRWARYKSVGNSKLELITYLLWQVPLVSIASGPAALSEPVAETDSQAAAADLVQVGSLWQRVDRHNWIVGLHIYNRTSRLVARCIF